MGQRYFLIFAGLNAAMTPAIYYLFPETSGRSLEEMDEIFSLSCGFLDVVKCARRLPHRYFTEMEVQQKLDEKFEESGTLA